MCPRDAARLGLRPSGRSVRLKGLGDVVVGKETLPVEVRLRSGRSAIATFVVVPGESPIVVGRKIFMDWGLMKAFHEEVDDVLWVTEPEVVKGRS